MKIEYEQKIVAFIDVLGFSNLVYSKTTELISRYFAFVLNDFKDAVEKHAFNFLIISDSLVLVADDNEGNLKLMVKILYRLQQKLLEEEGVLVRGGISYGDLFLNKNQNIIVGPSLINAYKLELQARYPRIILDRGFISKYYSGTNNLIENLAWVKFIPPLPYKADFVYLNYCIGFGFTDERKKFNKVLSSLKENYYNNEYIDKYEWLKIHLETIIKASIAFLDGKVDRNKHERKRLRLLKEFNDGIIKL